mmetsp:Transcript_17835/g.29511  ORF Transcript_17835/g.29511 Transcript_17835/m.29511 type:complete len:104 (-) Transcript_17835:242-553(-)|eukprot:CAMPEP_0119013706 /NCGR_PEP_ID=MMETSP1176-20130426/8798_1 /TAXON_ID=265551 /ORGANISM="Synedropsis recta cf, Strain CCMP1620" /LENGTH=103 /DNA_ID=CAMNT_0006966815 /DNA_START=37 /DNA_END=348 /DNA_ORIENTATION=+
MNRTVALLLSLLVAALTVSTEAFVAPGGALQKQKLNTTPLNVFGKKKEDLSSIETRDMTREEMIALNAKNEEIMSMELGMMTGVSLLFSLPILYLCWVAFFSD